MTHTTLTTPPAIGRATALADRLEQGARALITFARTLTAAEWTTRVPHDGRTIGVIVHHVASVYPLEIQLAQAVGQGQAVTGVTMQDVDAMNAKHAVDHAAITKEAAIALLERNSAAAAAAIRALTDERLATAMPVSLYGDAPLTCQFVLEDHAVRHSYHHLARLRTALR
jgi:DinB superfamily